MSSKVGSIYFLIRGEQVKVGFSTDVQRRLATFQHSEADLLGRIDDVTMSDERAAHRYLGRWHVRGEWFSATPGFLDAMQELLDGALPGYAHSLARSQSAARRAVASIAAHESWANTTDRSARTAPARRALDEKFLTAAGGDPIRAEHLRKAHFQRLALKSAQVRAGRRRGLSR
jgi:hypothetical protein